MRADETPAISAGSLDDVAWCAFRLAGRLRGDGAPRAAEVGPLRLWSELTKSLRAGHEHAWDKGLALDQAIEEMGLDVAGGDLCSEEAIVFGNVIETYLEAFGTDALAPHPLAGERLRRRIPVKPAFDLTGRADLLFAFEDQPPLVRRVRLRGNPHQLAHRPMTEGVDLPASTSDYALALLLKLDSRESAPDVVLRSETLWVASDGQTTTRTVTRSDLDSFRSQIRATVEKALAAPVPSPSWRCNSCEFLVSCPTVPSHQSAELLSQLDASQSAKPLVALHDA